MLKLANHTKILFIRHESVTTEHHYMGWNSLGSLAHVLNARLKQENPSWGPTLRHQLVHKRLETLKEKGYLTPTEAMDGPRETQAYWVVEKAIPFDIREAVKNNEVPLTDILKQLKV